MKKNKIVLIYPEFTPPVRYWHNTFVSKPYPPFSVVSIGGYLKLKGYEVKIIDMTIEKKAEEMILRECEDALAVGISLMTLQVKKAIDISKMIKSKYKIPIIFGGIHATLYPKQTSRDPLVDFVVVGEGEETIVELLDWIKNKKQSLKNIKGLAYKEKNKIIITEERPKIDLDKLPFCDYSLFDGEDYIPGKDFTTRETVRKGMVETSRGCPHRCAFCINVFLNNRRYRMRSVKKIMQEIDNLVKKHKINYIQFWDENFFANKARVKEICQELIKRNYQLRWSAHCRVDYFKKGLVDDEILDLCKKSGLNRMIVGAESGSDYVLNLMKKDITSEQTFYAVKKCKEYKIQFLSGFMLGIPGERKKDIVKTIKMIKKIKKISPEMFGNVFIYRPYPGSELYEKIKKTGVYREPLNLRDWIKEKYNHFMTSRLKEIPWNKNSKLIINITHYADLYLIPKYLLLDHLKTFKLIPFGYVFFILLAKLRLALNFYNFPLDKHLYLYFKKRFS